MTDQQAIQILKTITQSQLHGDLPPTALHQALTTNFGPPLPGSGPPALWFRAGRKALSLEGEAKRVSIFLLAILQKCNIMGK